MLRISLATMLAGILLLGAAAKAASPALRFCPEGGVWTYSLNDQRGLNSLVLQSVALVNPTASTFEATSAQIDLMSGGKIKESHLLSKDDLTSAAAKAPMLEGIKQALPGMFCEGRLLGQASLATTSTIAAGKALLLFQQTFAWSGTRDAVRVVVRGTHGGKAAEVTGEIPIRAGASKTAFHFPLKGVWLIGAAPSLQSHHRWAPFEEFAYDIVHMDSNGLTYTGDGSKFSDYYAYGAPIYAAADGKVVETLNDEPEVTDAMRRGDESEADYDKRLLKDQAARLARGAPAIIGNHVVIDHGNGEYSIYAHMRPNSVRVTTGQSVKAGEQIGELGSSGNSTEPHLHFQVCDKPNALSCAGIPIHFVDLGQGTAQTGDVITIK